MHLILLLLIHAGLVWCGPIDLQSATDQENPSFGNEDLYRLRGGLKPPPGLFDFEELNRFFFTDHSRHTKELRTAKYYLLNGEIDLAAVYLMKLTYANTKLRPVIYRYMAMLTFIEGDFKKSYEFLTRKELDTTPHYGKVCGIRILTQIILNLTHNLEDQWARCQAESYGHFIVSNHWWIDTLINLKLHPRPGITKAPFAKVRPEGLNNDELKIFLKLAIYLNQEGLLLSELPTLSVDQLQDTEVRELVGHIYFRTGSLASSYKYIEDLKSPNAEDIKGNLYILRTKYELAYAQFKLALEQKQNSQNAMERLLPLAWLLQDWASGANYAERIIPSPQTYLSKMTLAAAFHIQKGSFDDAKKILNTITQKSQRGGELEVTQLYGFTALMQNAPDQAKKYAGQSCAQYDLISCWLLYQLGQWDGFPLMIRRDDKIKHKTEWEKLTKEDIKDPLKEIVYVNQLDVEELDDKLIRLVPEEKK